MRTRQASRYICESFLLLDLFHIAESRGRIRIELVGAQVFIQARKLWIRGQNLSIDVREHSVLMSSGSAEGLKLDA